MSLQVMAGFETGDTYECVAAVGQVSVVSAVPPTDGVGAYVFRVNPGSGQDGYGYFRPTLATGYLSVYMKINTMPSGAATTVIRTTDGSNIVSVEVKLNILGKLDTYIDGSITPQLGSTILSTGVWYLIQLKNPGTNNGTAELYIDEVLEYSIPNSGLSHYTMEFVYLGRVDTPATACDIYFDSLTVDSAAYNPAHISRLNISGAGTLTTNFPQGTTYQDLDDDVTDNDSTVGVTTNDALNTSYATYALPTNPNPSLPPGSITVVAMKPYAISKVSSNPGFNSNLDMGATLYFNSNSYFLYQNVSVSFGTYRLIGTIWETNPDTALAWLKEDIDEAASLEVGPYAHVGGGGIGITCTAAAIMLAYTASAGPPPSPTVSRRNVGRPRRFKNLL